MDNRRLSSGFAIIRLNEAPLEGPVEDLVGQFHRQSFEVDEVQSVGQQVAGMTAPELAAVLAIAPLEERRDDLGPERQLFRGAEIFENPDELVLGRTAHQHLVLDAPQESLVPEVGRV